MFRLGQNNKSEQKHGKWENAQICMPCNGRAAKRRWKEFRLKASTSTDTFAEELNEYIYSPKSVTLQDPAILSSVLTVTQRFLIVWKNRLH